MFFFSFLRKTFFFPPAAAFAISQFSVVGCRFFSLQFRYQPALQTETRRLACYFLPGAFFLAIVARRGPLRVRALVCVRWPRTGSPRRWRSPRYAPISIKRLMSI